jgi:RNA polymerase sigma-70 factor, ECF subfamily
MDESLIQINRNTDEELMALILERNSRAMKLLYERYSKSIFNFILRYTNNREFSEDALQETFTRMWFAAHTFNPKKGTFKAWIFTIALNITRNEMSKKRYDYQYVSHEEIVENNWNESDPKSDNQPDFLKQMEVKECITIALEKLSPFLREVIILRHYQDLKFSEISIITNTPEGTLKARFHNALAQLKKMLEAVEI